MALSAPAALNACGYSFLWLPQPPPQRERSPQGRGYSFFAADTAASTVDRSCIVTGLRCETKNEITVYRAMPDRTCSMSEIANVGGRGSDRPTMWLKSFFSSALHAIVPVCRWNLNTEG